MVSELGARDVSTALIVEAWKAKGGVCDEQFFMHFDILHSYQFLTSSNSEEKPLSIDQLLEFSAERDSLVTITHEGQTFFERYF